MNNEILKKLIENEGVKSLQFEKKTYGIYEKYKWNNIHSPYFKDSVSLKLRELDILSRAFFEKKKEPNNIISEILLFTECKSLTEYHLIVDAETNTYRDENYQIWIGYDIYDRNNKMIEILKKTSLSGSQKKMIIKEINNQLFPKESSVLFNLIPPAFPDIRKFSTFREIKINSTKDLDNSVLWKAFQSLNSACLSYEIEHFNNIESNLIGSIDYIKTFDQKILPSLKNLFFYSLFRHMSIHKIMVTDAKLWISENESLTSLPYFRLLQKTTRGHQENWIDVVNIEHLDNYVNALTKYYFKFYSSKKMKRVI